MNSGRGRQRRRKGGPRNNNSAGGAEARAGTEPRRNTRGPGRSRANAKNAGDSSSSTKKPVPVVDEEAVARAAEEEALKRKQDEEARVEAERVEKERKEAERIENERKKAEKAAEEERERELMAQRAAELLEKRRLLRIANSQYIGDPPAKGRITEAELRKLDSSVKKCTAFIRKLRGSGINEDTHKSLLADVRVLNLSRYISEVVTAISECRLRSSDSDYAIVVASELHQRFEEFAGQLSTALSSVVLCTHPNASKDLPNRRGAMRLLVEVYLLSMHNDVSSVTSVLKELMKAGRESKEIAVPNLSVIASFVRAVSRALLAPPSTENDKENGRHGNPSWEDDVAPAQTKQVISSALESYYKSEATKLYEETKEDLREAELSTLRARQTRGSVDDASQAKHDAAKSTFERIFAACTSLADALGLSAPNPITKETDGDVNKTADNGVYAVFHGKGAGARSRDALDAEGGESESLFESEEDRAFYNDLPDTAKKSEANETAEPIATSPDSKPYGATAASEPSNENASAGETKSAVGATSETSKTKPEASKETEKSSGRSSRKKGDKNPSLDHLLARLGATETRENADRFTYLFISAAESSRKPTQRLAKSLIAVSPQKLNVLPAYSRIAASLRPVYPDVALSVSETLDREFRIYAERTDLDEKTLSSCIKTARYVGEYCKFRMMDYETVFSLLNFCIKDLDFTGHRVDMACHLLESCGRMIYRTPSSSIRMGNLLDTVWRLKSVKNLEPRHNTLVETAFHAARPASGVKLQRRKNRPPMKEYIRRLIYTWLTPESIRFTALQMKRLPWDEEIQSYVIKKFIKVNRMKFSTIPFVAMLIAQVGKYRKEVLVGVVDGILEAIRAGMERNDGRDAQRRVSEVALLGELYNSTVLSEKVVFFVLYQFITLGHEAPGNSRAGAEATATALLNSEASGNNTDANESLDLNVDVQSRKLASTGFFLTAPDPPRDYFRIRLVCTLIESCGQKLLFEKRRKVRVFWTLFERYAYCKAVQSGLDGQLPLHIDHILSDAFEKMNRRDAYASDGRKPLVEGNSRMRLRSKEAERKRIAALNKQEAENPDDKWERALSLGEALRNAQEAESNPIDLSLISLPVRSINLTSSIKKSNAKEDGNSVGGDTKEGSNKNVDAFSNGVKLMRRENGSTSPDADDEISLDTDADVLEEVVDEDDDDVEGNEILEGDEVDGDVGSEDGSMQSDFEDDDDSENSGDDEDEDDEDEDEIVPKKMPKSEEEEMFERELAAFTAAERQTARESTSRVQTVNRMAIPMGLMAQKRAEERAAAAAAEQNGEGGDSSARSTEGKGGRKKIRVMEPRVEFKFLVRKGGKSAIQDLSVPVTSSLAVAARESESLGAAAQEEKKRLVLASSIVVNGDDDEGLEQFVPLRTQQDAKAKEQSIKEQRTADEAALLATLFSGRKKR